MKKGFSLPAIIRWTFFAVVAGPALVIACVTILIFCGVCLILRKDPFDYIHVEGVRSEMYFQRLSSTYQLYSRLFRGKREKTNIH
jgi:hypothetical protein